MTFDILSEVAELIFWLIFFAISLHPYTKKADNITGIHPLFFLDDHEQFQHHHQ